MPICAFARSLALKECASGLGRVPIVCRVRARLAFRSASVACSGVVMCLQQIDGKREAS